jgi:hypothetical protein
VQTRETAAKPHVTITVMPAIAHAANASGFVLADDAAWCEHMAAGGAYTNPQIVTGARSRHRHRHRLLAVI